ncbi:hypothetical protein [Streptomyces sp. NPDC012746]|uniref:hypothetical protein n=1 Tax=Streptomyces sp. NPDC012746 TaxID=3364845 RepID=UPI003682A8D1
MTTSPYSGNETDEQSFIETAQGLLATRLDVVRPLAQLIAERKRLQALLDDVEKNYGAAYVAAQAGGWTVDELGQMGASEPTRRPLGRPRKRAAKAPSRAVAPPAPRSPETAPTDSPVASV